MLVAWSFYKVEVTNQTINPDIHDGKGILLLFFLYFYEERRQLCSYKCFIVGQRIEIKRRSIIIILGQTETTDGFLTQKI